MRLAISEADSRVAIPRSDNLLSGAFYIDIAHMQLRRVIHIASQDRLLYRNHRQFFYLRP